MTTAIMSGQPHRKESTGPLFINATAIAAELRSLIRGEVRFDSGSRAFYATDGSNYRQVPIGVVIPTDDRGCASTPLRSAAATGCRSCRAAAARA